MITTNTPVERPNDKPEKFCPYCGKPKLMCPGDC